jgi:hypothetical protein
MVESMIDPVIKTNMFVAREEVKQMALNKHHYMVNKYKGENHAIDKERQKGKSCI